MSDFISNNLHKKVDHIMDVFFGAGVASHPTIIEQINYLLFMRALSQRDDDLRLLGVNNSSEIVFDGELEKYHWDNLLTLNAEQLFIALEECFRKIPESTTNKTVKLVFRNAHLKLFDKPSLRTVLHQIDEFGKLMDENEHAGKRDVFGDTYEYLLSKLSQAGTSGQFRTPRHIIEFIVDVVAPKKGETIIDPAVGTAGFLVKAYEYLRKNHTSPETFATGGSFDLLNNTEHTFLLEHTFTGFDSDEDMIKFGMMNLYLHGLKDAKMIRQNTLTDTAGNRDKYDVVLANPPFAGKLDKDSVAEELQMNTAATEVLFIRYMLRHLTENGRAGVIVPEGVLFNASGAHIKIREMLLQNGLWCVVSLPSGVFNPYAGVKTSILFFDKTRIKNAEVLFAKIDHDGFSLGAQRRPIAKNDLPEILADIERYKAGEDLQQTNAHAVSYEKIKETSDFNLSGDRYKTSPASITHEYPMVELGEVLAYEQPTPYIVKSVDYDKSYRTPVLTAGKTFILGYTNETEGIHDSSSVIIFDDFTTATKFVDFPFKVKSSAMKILSVRDASKADIRYVFRAMGLINFTPGEHKRYWISQYSKFKIPLPPIEIQQKIVTEIESKQEAIDHARGLIATLERERRYFDPSARATRENWPVVKFSDIVDVAKKKWQPGNDFTKYVGLEDIESNTGRLVSVQASKPKSTKSAFKNGDILYGRLRPNLNKVWESNMEAICSTDFIVLRPRSSVIAGYLKTLLLSQRVNGQIVRGVSGANLPRVSTEYLLNLEVPLPSLETQKQIVAEFAEQDKWIEAARNTIDFMEKAIEARLASI